MEYTFVSEPNMLVRERIAKPFVGGFKCKTVCRFDENGRLTTDDPVLIKKLMNKFRVEAATDSEPEAAPEVEEVDATIADEPAGALHCKKCEFTCDNKGILMAHYRSAHSKEAT